MSDDTIGKSPVVFSSKERAALVAKALGEAARRARYSTKSRRNLATGSVRARRGDRLVRRLRIGSFIAIVLVPGLIATGYICFVETPQYVAEARFTLRGGLPPTMDTVGALTGAPSMLIVQDTQIIMNYMTSRTIVEALDKSIGLQRLFQKPQIDRFSRLKKNQSIEKVLAYWKKHISLSVQMPAGIVVMTVRAFSADDAVTVANAAIDASDQLVNQMNDDMRKDAVQLAENLRKRAQAEVVVSRSNLEKARNAEGMLNPEASTTAVMTLVAGVQKQLITMQEEFDSQRRYVRADAPQLKNLRYRIDAAKQQLASLQGEMTLSPTAGKGTADPGAIATDAAGIADVSAGPSKAISGAMSRLNYASMEDLIADKIYATSIAALEHARVASETKLMYINTFVHPQAAEQAKYPMRGLDTGLVLLVLAAIWGAFVGALTLVRGSFV